MNQKYLLFRQQSCLFNLSNYLVFTYLVPRMFPVNVYAYTIMRCVFSDNYKNRFYKKTRAHFGEKQDDSGGEKPAVVYSDSRVRVDTYTYTLYLFSMYIYICTIII